MKKIFCFTLSLLVMVFFVGCKNETKSLARNLDSAITNLIYSVSNLDLIDDETISQVKNLTNSYNMNILNNNQVNNNSNSTNQNNLNNNYCNEGTIQNNSCNNSNCNNQLNTNQNNLNSQLNLNTQNNNANQQNLSNQNGLNNNQNLNNQVLNDNENLQTCPPTTAPNNKDVEINIVNNKYLNNANSDDVSKNSAKISSTAPQNANNFSNENMLKISSENSEAIATSSNSNNERLSNKKISADNLNKNQIINSENITNNTIKNYTEKTGVSSQLSTDSAITIYSSLESSSNRIETLINDLVNIRTAIMLYISDLYNGTVELSTEEINAINSYNNIIKEATAYLKSNKGTVQNHINEATGFLNDKTNASLANSHIIRATETLNTRCAKLEAAIVATYNIANIIKTNLENSGAYVASNSSNNYAYAQGIVEEGSQAYSPNYAMNYPFGGNFGYSYSPYYNYGMGAGYGMNYGYGNGMGNGFGNGYGLGYPYYSPYGYQYGYGNMFNNGFNGGFNGTTGFNGIMGEQLNNGGINQPGVNGLINYENNVGNSIITKPNRNPNVLTGLVSSDDQESILDKSDQLDEQNQNESQETENNADNPVVSNPNALTDNIELIENENSNLKSQEEQTTPCSAQLILVENSNTDQNDVKDISAEQSEVDVIDPEFSVDPEKFNNNDKCKNSNGSHKLKTLEYKLDKRKNNKDSNLDGLANLSIGDNIENKEDNNEKNINNKKEIKQNDKSDANAKKSARHNAYRETTRRFYQKHQEKDLTPALYQSVFNYNNSNLNEQDSCGYPINLDIKPQTIPYIKK